MDETPDDGTFLVSSAHRVGVLEALAEGPCDRNDLREATGASSPTMGRILSAFEDRHWIEREGSTYRLTSLGQFVAERLGTFLEELSAEKRLRDVAPWLPVELDGFRVDLLTDAVVSYPGPGYPYEPLERNAQLMEHTESIRGFGMVMLKSNVLEVFFESVADGLDVEMIYPPHVLETMLAWDRETVAESLELDNHAVYVHEDLPNSEWCGLCLTDDRLSICCYESETGMIRSLVDTGSPRAYTWGESIVERYRADARPIDDEDALDAIHSTR